MTIGSASIISAIWPASIVAELVLAAMVVRARRGQPQFLLYIASHFAWNAILFPIHREQHPAFYFYFYWYGRALLFMLECNCVGFIVGRILRPLRSLPVLLLSLAVAAASSLCAVGWYLSNSIPSQRTFAITRAVFACERGLTTVEAALLMLAIATVSVFAFRWTVTEAYITAGFASHALATMLSAALFTSASGPHIAAVRVFVQAASLVTLGFWLYGFSTPDETTTTRHAQSESERITC